MTKLQSTPFKNQTSMKTPSLSPAPTTERENFIKSVIEPSITFDYIKERHISMIDTTKLKTGKIDINYYLFINPVNNYRYIRYVGSNREIYRYFLYELNPIIK